MSPTAKAAQPKVTNPKQYRYVGAHATILDGGQPLAPGDYVTLGDEDLTGTQNAMLIEEGHLIDAEGFTPTAAEQQPADESAAEPKTTEGGTE